MGRYTGTQKQEKLLLAEMFCIFCKKKPLPVMSKLYVYFSQNIGKCIEMLQMYF
jgi:hypothetical protein